MNPDFEIKDGELIKYLGKGGDIIIPDGVTSIGSSAFSFCSSLTSVSLPNSVTSIGFSAFHGCSGLISVTIPDSVTSIRFSAFQVCSGLTSVTIPYSVTSIDTWAFKNCSSLTSVTIPYSVTSIDTWAFKNCSSLISVTIDGATINLPETENVETGNILSMIIKKHYSIKINNDIKYNVIFQMYALGLDKEGVSAYISENFSDMFPVLINMNHTEILQKILDSEKFVTKRNIDKMIQYAIAQQNYQIQLLLTEYKQKKGWYQEIGKALKL